MNLSQAKPEQLAGLSALGSLLMAVAFLLLGILGHYRHHGFGYELVAAMMFLCGGAYLGIWGQQELKNGVQSTRWTDTDLCFLRKIFGSWTYKIALGTLLAVAVVVLVREGFDQHGGVSMVYWVCFVLSNGLMNLSRALAAPVPSKPQTWLHTSVPLKSEHWGQSSQQP